ncbi:hypothetical protein AGIG_G14832 [Arapaima gigas]
MGLQCRRTEQIAVITGFLGVLILIDKTDSCGHRMARHKPSVKGSHMEARRCRTSVSPSRRHRSPCASAVRRDRRPRPATDCRVAAAPCQRQQHHPPSPRRSHQKGDHQSAGDAVSVSE